MAEKKENKLVSTLKKIGIVALSIVILLIVHTLLVSLINVAGVSIFDFSSDRALRNIEAIANIASPIIAVYLAMKFYQRFS